jgi:membrane protease YdiL (CAAX protease family)
MNNVRLTVQFKSIFLQLIIVEVATVLLVSIFDRSLSWLMPAVYLALLVTFYFNAPHYFDFTINKSVWKRSWVFFLLFILYYSFLFLLYLIVFYLLKINNDALFQQLIKFLKDNTYVLDGMSWLDLMAILLLAPVAEEVFFRGYLFDFFRNRCKSGYAIIWVSTIFSVLHLDLIGAFLFSLLVFYSLIRSVSMIFPILLHTTNNAVAILVGNPFVLVDMMASNQLLAVMMIVLFLTSTLLLIQQLLRGINAIKK